MKYVLKVLVSFNILFVSSVVASQEDFEARLVAVNDGSQPIGVGAEYNEQGDPGATLLNRHRRPHPIGFALAPATPGTTAAQLAGAAAGAFAASVLGQPPQIASQPSQDPLKAIKLAVERIELKLNNRADGFDLFTRDASRFLCGLVVGVVAAPTIRRLVLQALTQGNR